VGFDVISSVDYLLASFLLSYLQNHQDLVKIKEAYSQSKLGKPKL
jgi:hypothetical protein